MLVMMLALVIIGVMFYFMTRASQSKPEAPTKSFVRDAGVDTSSYKGMLDSTKKVIQQAEDSRAGQP